MEAISRKEAKSLGLKRYFTGLACKYDHYAERYLSSGNCVACVNARDVNLRVKNKDRNQALAAIRYAEKKEEILRKNRDYRDARKSVLLEKGKEYRRDNSEKIRLQKAKHYRDNREAILRDREDYRRANPELIRASNRNRRAKLRSAEGFHTAKDVINLRRLQRDRCANCACCLKKSGYHVDHVTPLALGGSNWPENLQILCPSCNTGKQDKHPVEWAKQNGRLL